MLFWKQAIERHALFLVSDSYCQRPQTSCHPVCWPSHMLMSTIDADEHNLNVILHSLSIAPSTSDWAALCREILVCTHVVVYGDVQNLNTVMKCKCMVR
jgi:hypothetical protein